MSGEPLKEDLLAELAARPTATFRTSVLLHNGAHSKLNQLARELGMNRSTIVCVALTRLHRELKQTNGGK